MKYLPKTGNLLDLGYSVSSCDISSKALEILNEKNKNIKQRYKI